MADLRGCSQRDIRIDIDDLTVVESREKADQYLPGSDSSQSQDNGEQTRETAEEESSQETRRDVSSDDLVSGTESESKSEAASEAASMSAAADSAPPVETDEGLDLHFSAEQEAQLRERYDDYDDLSHDDLVERIMSDVMFTGQTEGLMRQRQD